MSRNFETSEPCNKRQYQLYIDDANCKSAINNKNYSVIQHAIDKKYDFNDEILEQIFKKEDDILHNMMMSYCPMKMIQTAVKKNLPSVVEKIIKDAISNNIYDVVSYAHQCGYKMGPNITDHAIICGNIQLILWFLSVGYKMDDILEKASLYNRLDVLQWAIQYSGNNEVGPLVFIIAAYHGHLEILQFCFQISPNNLKLECCIAMALKNNKHDVVQFLTNNYMTNNFIMD